MAGVYGIDVRLVPIDNKLVGAVMDIEVPSACSNKVNPNREPETQTPPGHAKQKGHISDPIGH